MISKEMLQELRQILKEDYGIDLDEGDLADFGYSVVSYFEILMNVSRSIDKKI